MPKTGWIFRPAVLLLAPFDPIDRSRSRATDPFLLGPREILIQRRYATGFFNVPLY